MAFSHVLSNIIHNAIKFSHKNGHIHISAHSENGTTKICIEYSGIGLESGSEELIFNRFTKYSRPGTDNEKSTGLGLFLAQQIIELHHGRTYAQSKGKNKGTVFTIALPT